MQKNEADILECLKLQQDSIEELHKGIVCISAGLQSLSDRITKLETSTATYSIEGRRLNC